MTQSLRVLIVEDERESVRLMVRFLHQSDVQIRHRHVDCSAAYVRALGEEPWDVILCDYSLPDLSAAEALRILHERGDDIPFIIVSGRIEEETAAEMMRAGADDFVNKVNLSRLAPALLRAVADAGERRKRRETEATRARLDTSFRNVVRENADGIVILGGDGKVRFANPAVEALLERPQAELLGKEFGTPVFNKQSVELKLIRRSGRFVDVEMRATATEWDGCPAVLLSLRDMTERKEAEQNLRRLNRALAMLSHCNRTLVRATSEQWLLDEICRIVLEESDYGFAWVGLMTPGSEFMRAAARAGDGEEYLAALWARRPDGARENCPVWQAIGAGAPYVLQDTAQEDVASAWREVARDHGYRSVIALPLAAGAEIMGSLNIYSREVAAFNPDEITLLEELAGDLAFGITALRREAGRQAAEAALRASEERFRKALIHAPLATMIHAEDGEIVTINEAWTRITGYTHEDIPDVNTWFRKAYGEKAAEVEKIMRSVYAAYIPTITGEFNVRTKAGDHRYLFFSTAPLGNLPDGRRAIIEMALDVTEQRSTQSRLHESEEKIRQLQKLESIGRLAGGVAHDFNNILHAIGGYAEFAQDQADENSVLHQDISQIRKLVDRASSLTHQLLAFSRKQTLQAEILDLNDQIDESLKLLHRLIGEDIALSFHPGDDLAPVHADPGQIYQVIMNLAVNARDAMPQGGELAIETANTRIEQSDAECREGISPGEYVRLAISDTGTGMDADTRSNLFEPFFTTKDPGRGTGLGLSTVYGIVKQHGGDILVQSAPGCGTTFRIYLPCAEQQKARKLLTRPENDLHGQGETILVAEDEAAIRYVVTRFLSAYGYTVIAAEDGEKAIEEAAAHAGSIALLITDVVMPGLGGRELYATLRGRYPDLRVLYMSGYTDDAIVRHGVLQDGTPFIQKPFGSVDLVKSVRKILDQELPPQPPA